MKYTIKTDEQFEASLEEWTKIESHLVDRKGQLRITPQNEMLCHMNDIEVKNKCRRNKLADLIYESGLLHDELATILGCPKSALEQYVRGAKTPSLTTALTIAKLFKVNVEDVFD